jgi:hypothetical protein
MARSQTTRDNGAIVRFVTNVRRLLIVAVMLVGVGSAIAPAANSGSTANGVVFLTIAGQGTVTSVPRGISCPKTCRVAFGKDALVRLVAHPSAGWSFGQWAGSCEGTDGSCSFSLTSPHDCAGGLCTIGAFGVRVTFVRGPAPPPASN